MAQPQRKNSMSAGQLSPSLNRGGQTKVDAPLTEMQTRFVENLVHHKLNQTAAARLAGFNQPATSANTLMKNPRIQRAIAIERDEYAKASGMTKQKVIDGFAEAIDLARLKADPVAMIAGWREIGKMCGFYEAQKTEITVSMSGQVLIQRLNSMSDEELLQLAQKDMSVLDGDFQVVDHEADVELEALENMEASGE